MIKFTLLVVFFSLFLSACENDSIKPYKIFKSDFNTSKISEIEIIVNDFSSEKSLTLFQKDKRAMKALSLEKDAFFIALYFKENPIFSITNVGTSNILVITVSDFGNIDLSNLDLMSEELTNKLNQISGIQLELIKN
ncbi:MAG: hypothetical protein OXE99_12750 [Cellvibrionales bacterium]|nr:hypothetical protein [Cellvibrionales bacterium]